MGFRQRPDRVRGVAEVSHHMVVTGTIARVLRDERLQNEVIVPPVQVETCDAEHLSAALAMTLENHIFGCDMSAFFAKASQVYSTVNLQVVADCAASNLKFMRHFLSYMCSQGAAHDVLVTAMFSPCMLHQLARVLTRNLSSKGVSAPLFSITRLLQFSPLRTKTEQALEAELRPRFRWKRGPPPHGPTSSPEFRRELVKLLVGSWEFQEPSEEREQAVEDLFTFWNGDLRREDEWYHYCVDANCCGSEAESMRKAIPFAML